MTEYKHSVPAEAGKTSYDMIDPKAMFDGIPVVNGHQFLDLGCGPGKYTLHAARLVGDSGRVYAVDLWPEGIERIRAQAEKAGLENVTARVGDITDAPPNPGEFDVVLMATVLHDLHKRNQSEAGLNVAAKALKYGGKLAVMEFRKIDGPPGPPINIRLSADEVTEMSAPHGFRLGDVLGLGAYNYLITLIKE